VAYEVGTRPPFNFWRGNLSTSNQIAAAVPVPERVQLLEIRCFVAGSSGQAAQLTLGCWHPNGHLIARSDQFASGPGSSSVGGQRWEARPPQGTVILDPGTYQVGWFRSPSTWGEFSYQTGVGAFFDQTVGGISNVGGSVSGGNIGRTLWVEPVGGGGGAGAQVWDAFQGRWVPCEAQAWDAFQGRWVTCDTQVWDAFQGRWVPTGG
jgi:hypothetical protein